MIGRRAVTATLLALAGAAALGSIPAAAPALVSPATAPAAPASPVASTPSAGQPVAPVPTSACPPATSTPVTASTPLLNGKLALPAPPAPAATQVIACVGKQAIAGATVAHWSEVAVRAERHASGAVVAAEVMGFLISSYWVLGEAQALGVQPSAAQVRHNFDRIRSQQFPKRREFERFLRSSDQTVADLLFRVRLNLTSQRIQAHFVARHASRKAKLRALAHFIAGFRKRWTAQTACAGAYATGDCASVF